MTSVYLLLALNALMMIGLPLLLIIYIRRRWQPQWRLAVIGAATFIIAQLLHIPFNQFLLNPRLQAWLGDSPELGTALIAGLLLGLSAGIFEEGGRYIAYRRFATTARQWKDGLMLGAGHGGIEALFLGILAAVGIVNIVLIQSGSLDATLIAQGGEEALELARQEIASVIEGPRILLIAGAIERIFALTLHLAASLMVMQVFVRRQIGWLFAAIGWHALTNLFAATGVIMEWNPFLIEGILGVLAIVSFAIIWRLKTPRNDPVPVPQASTT